MSASQDGRDPQTPPTTDSQTAAGTNPQGPAQGPAGAGRPGGSGVSGGAAGTSSSTGPQDPVAGAGGAQDTYWQDAGAAGDAASGEDLAALLAEAQVKVAQYHDQLLRAHAEVENVRRRAQEDVAKARKFGTESFAESLIPVRDSLEAALGHGEQTAEDWRNGVEATLRQLNTAFERNQMREIAPVPGDAFDPHRHQAISTVPSSYPQGTVAQTLQKGYLIVDRVLRPALVMVSSGVQA